MSIFLNFICHFIIISKIIYIYIYIYTSCKAVDRRPEGSLFNSYYTEVYWRALLLSLDCSTPLFRLSDQQCGIKYIFESFVWFDLWLNTGLPGHCQILKGLYQWAGLYIYIYIYIYIYTYMYIYICIYIYIVEIISVFERNWLFLSLVFYHLTFDPDTNSKLSILTLVNNDMQSKYAVLDNCQQEIVPTGDLTTWVYSVTVNSFEAHRYKLIHQTVLHVMRGIIWE